MHTIHIYIYIYIYVWTDKNISFQNIAGRKSCYFTLERMGFGAGRKSKYLMRRESQNIFAGMPHQIWKHPLYNNISTFLSWGNIRIEYVYIIISVSIYIYSTKILDKILHWQQKNENDSMAIVICQKKL